MLEKKEVVNLYFYTDSIGFPRKKDQRPCITWPFILKDLLETHCGVKVYPYIRGLGGGTITDIQRIFNRDTSYFIGDKVSLSFAVFNVGIVDAAPRPFTYHLKKLSTLPYVGRYVSLLINKVLHQYRKSIQNIYSFRLTAPREFEGVFNRMVQQLNDVGIRSISIDTPLTPISLEERSPGLRQSIAAYNEIKHRNSSVIHVSTDWVVDEHYMDCGHHFSELGHSELAQRLYLQIKEVMNG